MFRIDKIFSTTEIQKLTKLAKQAQPKQKNSAKKVANNVPVHYIR